MAGERREPTGMMPLAVAWLPADEYPDWPTQWPDLADSDLVLEEEHGGSVAHAVYCQRMERRLGELRETGAARLLIAPLRASELTQWVADNQADERDPAQLRARYAADLGRDLSRTIAWPPGRNEPCWCGSGRKYKKCCAAPGSGGSRPESAHTSSRRRRAEATPCGPAPVPVAACRRRARQAGSKRWS